MSIRSKSTELTAYLRMGVHSYRGKLFIQASFWSAAIVLGVAAVYFTKLITYLQVINVRLYDAHPIVMSIVTPFAFLSSAAVCKYLAPHAGGSGVPQVLFASSLSNEANQTVVPSGLLSIRTALVKVLSTGIGFLGGASIGGEGPTVQISGSIFATFGTWVRKYFPHVDFHSYIVAAAGAGIAAAFNTPLGGIAFALEEFAVGDFGELRHMVMLAVIVAGLTTQAFIGNDLYLGHFAIGSSPPTLILWAIPIGILGGVMGGLFGRIVSSQELFRIDLNWWQRALACGVLVSLIGVVYSGQTAGSGYAVIQNYIEGGTGQLALSYPIAKLLATALSTLSGMGGGILAPSLSIGAWMGVSVGRIALFGSLKICALLGMAAYFSGAFQIPLTAVIVVTEMTNEHDVVFPMMVASLCAYLVARLIMPVSLYHVLIARNFHKKTLSD